MDDAVEIVPIRQDHIESFHRALDFVARERRYLAFLEAPPLEATRSFVLGNIEQGYPQLVALSAGEVVGWCDVTRKARPIYAHSGVLGIALLPEFRSRRIGRQLLDRTLVAARTFGFHRIELTVRENNKNAIELYKKAGFEIEGLLRDAVQIDGAFENVVLMATLMQTLRSAC
ncbi:GNAT family N-acetyltransferase [Bradyrhizobium lablabi]|uniref:GNAT family N-acetyltransferase n=1 Tax=Bradyrhizobium lablabi TaxID=722472 RepID=UPI001BA6F29B|nr:GNAT family N-acetyltransferase [Bradyrhizobium lablabi]MBR1121682.1 GNAT family N-acetyltransferase [Bradyrhizobium lablabi]